MIGKTKNYVVDMWNDENEATGVSQVEIAAESAEAAEEQASFEHPMFDNYEAFELVDGSKVNE